MQQEDFYKAIQEKLNLLETNSDWNKDAVWNRINRQEEVKVIKKSNKWFYFGAAASVAVVSLISVWILNNNNSQITDNQSIVNDKLVVLPIQKTEIKETISKQKIELEVQKESNIKLNSETPEIVKVPEQIVENKIEQASIPKNEVIETTQIVQNQPVEKQTEVSPNQETEEDHYDRKLVKPVQNRVVVLNIPVAEEENDRGKQKKSLVGRIFKKDKEKTERSDKIWAFVKESFKNESIEEKKDSTVR